MYEITNKELRLFARDQRRMRRDRSKRQTARIKANLVQLLMRYHGRSLLAGAAATLLMTTTAYA